MYYLICVVLHQTDSNDKIAIVSVAVVVVVVIDVVVVAAAAIFFFSCAPLHWIAVCFAVRMCWCSLQLALSRPMHNDLNSSLTLAFNCIFQNGCVAVLICSLCSCHLAMQFVFLFVCCLLFLSIYFILHWSFANDFYIIANSILTERMDRHIPMVCGVVY